MNLWHRRKKKAKNQPAAVQPTEEKEPVQPAAQEPAEEKKPVQPAAQEPAVEKDAEQAAKEEAEAAKIKAVIAEFLAKWPVEEKKPVPAAQRPAEEKKPVRETADSPEPENPPEILALNAFFKYERPSYSGEDPFNKIDDLEDETRINWVVPQGDSLERSIREYISFKPHVKEYEGRNLRGESFRILYWCFKHERTFFMLDSSWQLPQEPEELERLKNLAGENKIGIVNWSNAGEYYDLVSERNYNVVVTGTWWGSADDAATYGSIGIE